MGRPDRGAAARFLLPALFLGITVATVAAFVLKEWRPPVVSEHGKGVDGMISYLVCAAGFVFVVGHLVLAKFVWSYGGDGTSPAYRPIGRGTEMLFTFGPVVLVVAISEIGVLFIGGPVWAQVFKEDPNDVQIEVIAKQYEWITHYPGRDGKFGPFRMEKYDEVDNVAGLWKKDKESKDDLILRGKILLPAGRAAQIRIKSFDVLHSFNIPVFRTKQDAVPGIYTRTRVTPTTPGNYEIACAEICGPGHYKMRAKVEVVPLEKFQKWLEEEPGFFE
jgi:cytochrome c oxidase subunit 2